MRNLSVDATCWVVHCFSSRAARSNCPGVTSCAGCSAAGCSWSCSGWCSDAIVYRCVVFISVETYHRRYDCEQAPVRLLLGHIGLADAHNGPRCDTSSPISHNWAVPMRVDTCAALQKGQYVQAEALLE